MKNFKIIFAVISVLIGMYLLTEKMHTDANTITHTNGTTQNY